MTELTKNDYLKHGSIPADIVNHPPHYEAENVQITIEPIALCEQCGFLLGNGLKYLFRYQHKGKPLEDLKKAEFYLKRFLLQFGSKNGTDLTIFKFNYVFEAFKNKDFLRDVDVMTPPKKNIENILEWTQAKIYELEIADEPEALDSVARKVPFVRDLYRQKKQHPEQSKEINEYITAIKNNLTHNK